LNWVHWDNRDRVAADLARAGGRRVASGSIGARLSSLEARALARLGDETGALAALNAATTSRAANDHPDELLGVFSFPVAKQAAYAGTTYLALGGPAHLRKAVESSTEAVRLYLGAPNVDLRSPWLPGQRSYRMSVLGLENHHGKEPSELLVGVQGRGGEAGDRDVTAYRGRRPRAQRPRRDVGGRG
jgi:hypothetical protein